jgi:hypothetical protein
MMRSQLVTHDAGRLSRVCIDFLLGGVTQTNPPSQLERDWSAQPPLVGLVVGLRGGLRGGQLAVREAPRHWGGNILIS